MGKTMDLFEKAATQHGVFSIQQATEHGHTRAQLRTLADRRAIEPHLPGVYRVTGSPATWHRAVWAATLWLPGSLASHRCAARLWGLGDFDQASVELVVQRWDRRCRPPHVIVHETKDLVGGDHEVVDGIPCTSIVRTLVDLPAVAHEFRAGNALDQAFRRNPTILKRVRARHQEVARRGRNGTVKLRRLLEERGLGQDLVDSGFERHALRLIENSALPAPVTQHQIRDGSFVCYLDLAWPAQRVAVECDSIEHHMSVAAFRWDRERRRRLNRLGWTVLEFTYKDVNERGTMVLHEIGFHVQAAA